MHTPVNTTPVMEALSKQVNGIVAAEVRKVLQEVRDFVVERLKSLEPKPAPVSKFGYKADGTPKKRPGRQRKAKNGKTAPPVNGVEYVAAN